MSITSLEGIEPGDLFTTNGHDVWRVESYCEQPTITLKKMGSNQKTGGAVGCLNLKEFVRLIPEKPIVETK